MKPIPRFGEARGYIEVERKKREPLREGRGLKGNKTSKDCSRNGTQGSSGYGSWGRREDNDSIYFNQTCLSLLTTSEEKTPMPTLGGKPVRNEADTWGLGGHGRPSRLQILGLGDGGRGGEGGREGDRDRRDR